MFTGIVAGCGKVVRATKNPKGLRLVIQKNLRDKDSIKVGESISVNGVCLTAAKVNGKIFEADVIKETLQATNLARLKTKDCVNLERSLKYGDRFGGHFVTGHVDGRSKIIKVEKSRGGKNFWLEAPARYVGSIREKGSVALEGVSLTVQEKKGRRYKVSLVPHTLRETTLIYKKAGESLNLEVDLATRSPKGATMTLKKLRSQGF